MERMADLIARVAQAGQVEWIGVRPERRSAMSVVQVAEIGVTGLAGDRAKAGKRAITLVQAEHLRVIGAFMGTGSIAPELLRRNLLVSGINLIGLRGRDIQVGTAVLRVTGPCAPCSRMEVHLGYGGYAAVRGHGGMTAEVSVPGYVMLGDKVVPGD